MTSDRKKTTKKQKKINNWKPTKEIVGFLSCKNLKVRFYLQTFSQTRQHVCDWRDYLICFGKKNNFSRDTANTNANNCNCRLFCAACRTRLGERDLGVVGPEAGEVLLLTSDQSQQHDVSRGQEGERVVGVSTLSEERPQGHDDTISTRRSESTWSLLLSKPPVFPLNGLRPDVF